MTAKLVPADAQLAAKRGFIRTTAQALAATIPTAGVGGAALSGADWAVVAWAVGAAVLSSLLAGAASYLNIISRGIPGDYAPALPPEPAGGEPGQLGPIVDELDGEDPGPARGY